MRHVLTRLIIICVLLPFGAVYGSRDQTPELAFDEAQTVYGPICTLPRIIKLRLTGVVSSEIAVQHRLRF